MTRGAIVVGLLVVMLVGPVVRPSGAQVVDADVQDGCVDTVVGAVGLFENVVDPSSGISLDVPGPVVSVFVDWMGEFESEPADADIALAVSGPSGTDSGDVTAQQTGVDDAGTSNVYAYEGDATGLFGIGSAGTYDIDVTPPPDGLGGANHWLGATVTVVYDTSPCETITDLSRKVGADYYFGGDGGPDVTTDTIVYEFDQPLPAATTARVRMSHGLADTTTDTCRVSTIWAATGSGPLPGDLVDIGGNPVTPGATEAVIYPFSPPNQPCPSPETDSPVTAISGGYVGSQYGMVEMEVAVPVGATWVAFQLESPQDNGGFAPDPGPAEGVLGTGLLAVESPLTPDVALEKTVVAGPNGDCPGTGGTEEVVAGDPGTPVTYCFRVTNTGDTALDSVTLDDPALGITDADMTLVSGEQPLAPGSELIYSFEATIDGDLVNSATVTATPVDAQGESYVSVADVTDSNDATVEVVVEPGIALEKTVLDGPDGDCPGTEGADETVTGEAGAPVTYCFRITNTGNAPLASVTVNDPDLGVALADLVLVAGDDTIPLVPDGDLVYAFEASIDGTLTTTATATGTPVDLHGDPLSEEPVTATDAAGVEQLDAEPDPDPTPNPDPEPEPEPEPEPDCDTDAPSDPSTATACPDPPAADPDSPALLGVTGTAAAGMALIALGLVCIGSAIVLMRTPGSPSRTR